MKDIVKSLLDNIPNIYVVAICGNNQTLYSALKELNNKNLLVKGFIDNINEYIVASAIVLTKPGGLTSTEVATLRKPMIHIMPIPGVENHNASFFEENGMCLKASNVLEVVNNTKKLLEDKTLQQNLVEMQKKYINDKSAGDLVDYVIKNWYNK